MNYYFSVLKNFSFNGRARRAELWWFVLFNIIVAIVLNILSSMAGLVWVPGGASAYGPTFGLSIPNIIYTLAVLIQSLAVGVRRLHDRDMSGWWLLLAFIPFVGAIVLIVFYCLPGTAGPNKYGPDPKAA